MHQNDRIIMSDLNRSKIRYQQKLPGGGGGKVDTSRSGGSILLLSLPVSATAAVLCSSPVLPPVRSRELRLMCAAGRTHILGHPRRLPHPQMTRKYRPHHYIPPQTFSNIKAAAVCIWKQLSWEEEERGRCWVAIQFR